MTFLERLALVYPDLDLTGLRRCLVDDCCVGAVKIVLLCESPHTSEIQEELPLVGASGRSVASVLRKLALGRGETEDDMSIGRLVSQRDEDFAWLGLMNTCPLPMQKKPYCDVLRSRYAPILDDLVSVRKNSGISRELSGLDVRDQGRLG